MPTDAEVLIQFLRTDLSKEVLEYLRLEHYPLPKGEFLLVLFGSLEKDVIPDQSDLENLRDAIIEVRELNEIEEADLTFLIFPAILKVTAGRREGKRLERRRHWFDFVLGDKDHSLFPNKPDMRTMASLLDNAFADHGPCGWTLAGAQGKAGNYGVKPLRGKVGACHERYL